MYELAVWMVILIVLSAGAIGGGYLVGERILGQEAARRNMRYGLPWIALGFAIAFLTPIVFTQWLMVPLLYVIGVGGWLLSWPFRKQASGGLVFNAGRPPQSRFLLWIGLLEGVVAAYMTWSSLLIRDFYSGGSISTLIGLVFWWTLTVFFIALGLNNLELRKNGVCFMYTVIPWSRMISYRWEASKPTTLTIRLKPRLPILPDFMSVNVPKPHRGAIDRIVAIYISSETLSQSS
ncbi:MAG: hypothetical protein AAGF01_23880 [Cyanobacteria bacterium P01_G01_bin.38]